MPFTPADGVPCQLLPDGRLRVTAPLVWSGTKGDAVLIPAGTVTDLASVPRVARGLVDVGGPIGRAAIVHDVLCDAANAWSAAGCPEASRPRFLGPDIDGALRAAARDLQAATGERWLYWVAVRWGALFGSRGRRWHWWRTLAPVLALTVPAVAVALPAIVGALVARVLLVLCELVAWPWSGTAPVLREPARQGLRFAAGDHPRQLSAETARAIAAAPVAFVTVGGPLGEAEAEEIARLFRGPAMVLPGDGATVTPAGIPARAAARRKEQAGPGGVDVEADCLPECSAALYGTGVHDRACPARRLGPCPPGTHSNTGTAADEEIAACPRCNPRRDR